MATTLTINGEQKSFDAPAEMPLLRVLRDIIGMTGTKYGCGIAQCGATPDGALSMPAFGNAYTDDEIAAVANYVTARFGARGSKLTANDVAELRKQTAQ